jgi:hypothetical protein
VTSGYRTVGLTQRSREHILPMSSCAVTHFVTRDVYNLG